MRVGRNLRRSLVAIALTWAAGYVDAFGYLLLNGVYTANMSGNTVLVGVHGVVGDYRTALLHVATIGAFVAGLIVSGAVIKVGLRRGVRRVLAFAMALEALCLAALLAGVEYLLPRGLDTTMAAGWPLYLLVAITAVAMGIQNTSLRMADVLTVYTTHVTGALTRFGEDVVEYLFQRRTGPKPQQGSTTDAPSAPAARQLRLSAVFFPLALWSGFLLGAIVSAYATLHGGSAVLALPIAVVLLVGGLDCIAPLEQVGREDRA